MKHTVKFSSPREAMNYAIGYNRRGVHLILKQVRKRKGHFTLEQMMIVFSFAGIEGYPVIAFHDRYRSLGYAL